MRFFVLPTTVGDPYETEYIKVGGSPFGPAPRCPVCDLFVGMKSWPPPYRAELKRYGPVFGNVAFGVGASLLVSQAFRNAWIREKLVGFSSFDPVELTRVRPSRGGGETPEYFHVVVGRGGTTLDEAKSLLSRIGNVSCHFCDGGAEINAIHGLTIAERSWTGEDIFYSWGIAGVIVVTKNVRGLAADNELTNVMLTPVEDFTMGPFRRATRYVS